MRIISRINYRIPYWILIKSFFVFLLKLKTKSDNNIQLLGKNSILIDSARSGIKLALESLNLDVNAKIGVMAFNCHSVFNAIKIAGFDPIFIDINHDFSISIESLIKQKQIDVIVVSHLFGNISSIEKIKEIFPNIIVIEDCAHIFSLNDVINNGNIINGDFAVFSFNFGKFPAIGGGGVLIANDQTNYNNIKSAVSKYQSSSFLAEISSFLKKIIFTTIYNPYLYGILFQKSKKFIKKKNSTIINHSIKKMNELDKIILNNYLFILNDLYVNQQENIKNITENKINTQDTFLIPLIVNNRDYWIKEAHKIGVEIGSHFSNSIMWAKKFNYEVGSCPNSELIANNILTLPSYHCLKKNEIKKLNILYKKIKYENIN